MSSTDTLVLWRCNEVASGDNFVDAGPNARTLTQANSPGVVRSLFDGDPVIGARSFNGSNQRASQVASSGTDHAAFQWTWGESRGVCVDAWIRYSGAAQGTIVELGEFGESLATNSQIGVSVTAARAVVVEWEHSSGGTNVVNTTTGGVIPNDTPCHLETWIEDDPENFDRVMCVVCVNGKQVASFSNLVPPSGGTSARWIMGASWQWGSSTSAPGRHFQGDIDDVRVSRYPGSVEHARFHYAGGIRDFDEGVLAGSPFTHHYVRVWLQDFAGGRAEGAVGEWVDMGNAFGVDWVVGVDGLEEGADQATQGATVRLVGSLLELNLSPFARRWSWPLLSPVEQYESPWNTSAPFLGVMQRIKIEVATVPWGTSRVGAEPFYELRFDGYVKNVSLSGHANEVTLECVDKGAVLLDVMIEPGPDGQDRAYGASVGTAVEGELQEIIDDNDPARYDVLSIDDNGAGNSVIVTLFGTSTTKGRGKPHLLQVGDKFRISGTTNYNGAWTVAAVTSTTVRTVETTAGAFAAEVVGTLMLLPKQGYLGWRPQLWVPTSPSWNVYPWNAPPFSPVLSHIDEVVQQIGWRIAYAFDWHRQSYRLRLTNARDTLTFLVRSERLLEVRDASIESVMPRTGVVVEYGDVLATAEHLDEAPRRIVAATNAAAAKRLGRRIARIGIESESQVQETAEAQELASGVLSDLSDPVVEATVEMLFDGSPEVGDFLVIGGEQTDVYPVGDVIRSVLPRFASAPQVLGVLSVSHSLTEGRARTTLALRGGTSGAVRMRRHHEMVQQNGRIAGQGLAPPKTPSAPTCTPLSLGGTVRGVFVQWQFPVDNLNRAFDMMVVHISTTDGFTPSSATVRAVVRGENIVIAGLAASTTYRCRIEARDRMGNYSSPSSQTTFTTAA